MCQHIFMEDDACILQVLHILRLSFNESFSSLVKAPIDPPEHFESFWWTLD